jgi:hypothetical protein
MDAGREGSTAVRYKASDKLKKQDGTQEICNMRNKQQCKTMNANG